MEKKKIGFVGFGIMGQLYARAINEFSNSTVAAVSGTNSSRRESASSLYGCETFDTYQDMFRHAQLDAVIITLPDHLHHDVVVDAAQCGINMLVEKPFALSVRDAESMVEAIDRSGVSCMVEFFNRWAPPFARAQEMVNRGELGRILSVSADLNDTIYVPTGMLRWAEHSTPGWFLMSHLTDLVYWITEKVPKSVYARGTKQLLVSKGIDTYDVIEALVEYTDGTVGRFTNGWILPRAFPIVYELKIRLIGSEGAIDIDTSDQQFHHISDDAYKHTPIASGKVQGRYVGHYYEILRSFLDSLESGTEPLITHRDGLKNTRFLEAVHHSLESGQPVTVEQ